MRLSKNYPSSFLLTPVVPGDWRTLPSETAIILIHRLHELGLQPAGAEVDAVRILKPAFYPRWLICDLQLANGSDVRKGEAVLCLYGPDGCTPLDGRSARIHGHNAHHGVVLATEEQRVDYLQFFCVAVFGEDGPFRIVHPSTPLVRTIENGDPVDPSTILPLRSLSASGAGVGGFEATVSYARALFRAEFVIHEGGSVMMADESPLLDQVVIAPELQFRGSRRHLFSEVEE